MLTGREPGADLDGSPRPSASNLRFDVVCGGAMFERTFKDALDSSMSVLGGLIPLGLICGGHSLN